MTEINSSTAALLSRLAQSGNPSGVLHTGARDAGSTAGPATLFAASALGLRTAQLNALADEAGPSQQVRQVKSLLNEARTVADRARYEASAVAKVTGTAANLTPVVAIKADHSITVGGSADAEELASIGLSAGTTTGNVNAGRRDLAREFNAIRDGIDAVKLESDGSPVTAASLGIERVGGDFQSDFEVATALSHLDRAESTIEKSFPDRSIADRERFTRAAIELLSSGAQNLALAEPSEADALQLAGHTRTQLSDWRTPSIVGKPGEPLLRLFL
jgi:hypothetical protein